MTSAPRAGAAEPIGVRTAATFLGVGEWLARREQLTPDKPCLIDVASGHRFTYREFNTRVRALAAVLAERYGITIGDRVAVLAANSPTYLEAFFATALLGAILVPLNWRLTSREFRVILDDCAPKLLIADGAHVERAGDLASGTQQAEQVPAKTEEAPDTTSRGGLLARWFRSDGATAASSAPSAPTSAPSMPVLAMADFPGADADLAARAVPFATRDGEEPLLILYTSGTTGTPKGALLSHRMLTWNAINTQISWGLWDTDISPTFAPFFHAGGLNVLTTPLFHCGGTVVLLRDSDPVSVLSVVKAERCTVVFAVPTVFQAMMEHPAFAATDLSSVRFFVTGGSSCPLPVIEGYAARGLVFRQGYGLTEVGVNCFSLAPEDALRKAGSVGRPVFHSRARLVDEHDHEVPVGAVGELVLAGPHVCSGYWHRPEATAEAFRDGWWHTGDLARRDEEGYYTIVGRQKDMYISGGENVYPAEVEGVLATHPAVAEVAVFAEPDPKWGEVGCAVLVLRPGSQVTPDDLLAYCRDRLARYKHPKRFVFAETLPRNAMGKVIKAELRARYAAPQPAVSPALPDAER